MSKESRIVNDGRNVDAERDTNPDPITGEPGSHPLGTGIGATGGATTGAVVGGVVGGPIGGAVGVVVGGIVGGLAGKTVAEGVNPTAEDAYWRENYATRPGIDPDLSYDEYRSAYQYGWEAYEQNPGKRFEDIDSELGQGWESARGTSNLTWERAKRATRDAWYRLEEAVTEGPDSEDRNRP